MSNISLLCGMLFKVIPRFLLIKSTLYFYFMSIQNFGFIYLLVTFTLWRSGPKLDGYFFTFTLTFSTILRITLYFYFIKVKKPQSKEKTKYKVKKSKKSPTPACCCCCCWGCGPLRIVWNRVGCLPAGADS